MFPQFETSNWLRCAATDDDGFRCLMPPSHGGDHRWARCEWQDARGARCMLPPRHPGRHVLFWYDEPASPGDVHTVRFGGTRSGAAAFAQRASSVYARHGWVEKSRQFEPGLLSRLVAATPLVEHLDEPRGNVVVVFEYRPDGADAASGAGRT